MCKVAEDHCQSCNLCPPVFDVSLAPLHRTLLLQVVAGTFPGLGKKHRLPPVTFTESITHRQGIYERYDLFRQNKIELWHAVTRSGNLYTHVDYFPYTLVGGIDKLQPGLTAELMDSLADWGNFT